MLRILSVPLAYLTAKTNDLDDIAQEVLEEAGLTEADMDDVPDFGQSTLKPPPVVKSTANLNWPTISTGQSYFEKSLINGHAEGDAEPSSYINGIDGGAGGGLGDWMGQDEAADEEEGEDEAGWDLDTEEITAQVDVGEEVVEGGDAGAGAVPGVSETELWVRNSPFAADHVAAGSFESAMQVTLHAICRASLSFFDSAFSVAQPSTWCCRL